MILLLIGLSDHMWSILEESFLITVGALNGITLGPRQTDSINQMIPLTNTHSGWLTALRPNRLWIP